MGYFREPIHVGHPSIPGGDMLPVEAVVDTGASDSMFPASLFERLHVEPERQFRCWYANGESEMRNYGKALIRINDQTELCPVIFGPEGHFLLGATTLEIFKLAVDPVAEELIPIRGLRLGWGGAI